jgi:hypothetical protein
VGCVGYRKKNLGGGVLCGLNFLALHASSAVANFMTEFSCCFWKCGKTQDEDLQNFFSQLLYIDCCILWQLVIAFHDERGDLILCELQAQGYDST